MSVFQNYAVYYNLLYTEKNYAEEIAYIESILKKEWPECRNILDFGCGTGNHDFLLGSDGFNVCGVDLSEQMLLIAADRLKKYTGPGKIEFFQGNMKDILVEKKFDAVVSLFHAINYLTELSEMMQTFENAYHHLNSGGIFLFDFWYGPGVLTDRPLQKLKKIENEAFYIHRFTNPVMEYEKNIVQVNFEVIIEDKNTKQVSYLNEHHAMRYIFLPETLYMLEKAGFKTIKTYKWLTYEPLFSNSWYGVITARKEA